MSFITQVQATSLLHCMFRPFGLRLYIFRTWTKLFSRLQPILVLYESSLGIYICLHLGPNVKGNTFSQSCEC